MTAALFDSLMTSPLSACRAGVFSLLLLPVVSLFGDGLPVLCQSNEVEPLSIASLPNAHRLHPKIIAGGQPEGEAGFQSLSSQGVRTIISVDGAKPNAALSKKYGMRYVHLPHGYDGISRDRVLQLAKAVSDLPGPVYIHCHHGKHRSPAAAAVACVGAGYLSRSEGLDLLARMGTSPDYRGLHDAVARAKRIDNLKDQQMEFRESVEVPPIQAAMVLIERRFDQLVEVQRADWAAPGIHPDLSPAHEALLLREQLTELSRAEQNAGWPAEFMAILDHSLAEAVSLEQQLRGPVQSTSEDDHMRLTVTLASIKQDCVRCHQRYRDQPHMRDVTADNTFPQSLPERN